MHKLLRRDEWQECLQEKTDEVTRRRSSSSQTEEERGRAGSYRYRSVMEDHKENTNCDKTNSDTPNYTIISGTIQAAFSKAKFTVVINLSCTYTTTSTSTTTSTTSCIPTPYKGDLTHHKQVHMDALMMLCLAQQSGGAWSARTVHFRTRWT